MNKRTRNLLLIVLIFAIGGLSLFTWQNLSPSLSLTFLGLKSIPLPLSVWILGAFFAGVITYLLIYGIFGLSNYLLKKNLQPLSNSSRKSQDHPKTAQGRNRNSQSAQNLDSPTHFNLNKDAELNEADESLDDWEKGPPKVSNSWDGSKQEQDVAESQNTTQNFEAEQKVQKESWSGSVYSYGYGDSSDSGVGQTESVYDADYRVITPPPPSDTSKPTTDNE
ncbi:MAG: hypothetical protein AB4080_10450 [Trichodesmium sp.]